MPIIASAKKKVRKDKKRTVHNSNIESNLRGLIKKARRSPNKKSLGAASSALDKAAKIHLIHKNRASRLKSRLAQLLSVKH